MSSDTHLNNSNNSGFTGIRVPWYGFLMIFLLYATPFILMTPVALITGLFTIDEFSQIFRSVSVNFQVAVIIILGATMTFLLRKAILDYDGTEAGARTFNKKLKLIDTLNIVIPVGSMIWIGAAISFQIKRAGIELAAFEDTNPMAFIIMLFLGLLLDAGLLFYILHIRIIEPLLHSIPFKTDEIPLTIIQRNVLTLTFAVLGVLFLILTTLNPANLSAGTKVVYSKVLPIIAYSLVFFVVATLLLTDDIKHCLNEISEVTAQLSKKNYTVSDSEPNHRSEFGIIIQTINEFKNQSCGILRDIDVSTKKTSKQSDDLVHNMDTTKDNVENIVGSIASVQKEIESQATGVRQSNNSIEQIMENIRSLNNSIESQAAGVSHSSTAVEEMVANIASVTQILEKNNQVVNQLTSAADKGQRQVKTAVQTADEVLQQSAGILQASNIIQSISSRTNLLAMNAAIESAHAGEAGKGFAVVAEEIRKLAEQSSSQSKAIDDNLRSLSESINRITNDINLVQTAFESIYDLSQKVREQETVIANAMEEQNTGNQQVLEAMRSISNSTADVKKGSAKMLTGGEQILNEMKNLSEVTRVISDNMNQINDFSQQISDAVAVTTASTTNTQENLQALMQELSSFKLN